MISSAETERQPDGKRRLQRDEQAERFCKPELDVSVGKRRSQNGDDGIQPRNETVEGNLA